MSTSFVFGLTELNTETFVAVAHPDGAHNGHFDAVMSNASPFQISGTEDGAVFRPVAAAGIEADWKASGDGAPVLFYARAASSAGALIVTSHRT